MEKIINWLVRWLNKKSSQTVHIVGVDNKCGGCLRLSDGKSIDYVTCYSYSRNAHEPYGRATIEIIDFVY